MKAVFTAEEMAGLDSFAINKLKIPGLVLMENAGRGIADIALKMLKELHGKQVNIYCGSGNNGGDGYVVARHLLNNGVAVRVFVLAAEEKIKGDAKTNLDILRALDFAPKFIARLSAESSPDLIVDALLGTGAKSGLQGLYAEAVDFINMSTCPVLAVDIPTGVNADTGQVEGPAVRATTTATMAAHKRGLLFSPGREHVGELEIVDISLPPNVIEKLRSNVYLVDKKFVRTVLPQRSPDAHKNKAGMVHVIAGSTGFTGAAVLAAKAVLRSGAGLCYLSVAKSLNTIFESILTEAITLPVEDNDTGFLGIDHAEKLLSDAKGKDVIAIGPGLGQAPQTGELLRTLLSTLEKPLVLDADGLNLCAGRTELIINYRGDLILTPHPGEFSRLTELPVSDIIYNRVEIVRDYAKIWNCHIILKGGPTTIASPDGRVYINSTGNAGMATAGSGDVLTGIIAGLLGQGMPAGTAAVAGVYIHGMAGDMAAAELGQLGTIAGDILNKTPLALKLLAGETE